MRVAREKTPRRGAVCQLTEADESRPTRSTNHRSHRCTVSPSLYHIVLYHTHNYICTSVPRWWPRVHRNHVRPSPPQATFSWPRRGGTKGGGVRVRHSNEERDLPPRSNWPHKVSRSPSQDFKFSKLDWDVGAGVGEAKEK